MRILPGMWSGDVEAVALISCSGQGPMGGILPVWKWFGIVQIGS
jgi:hypothetical protein